MENISRYFLGKSQGWDKGLIWDIGSPVFCGYSKRVIGGQEVTDSGSTEMEGQGVRVFKGSTAFPAFNIKSNTGEY